MERRSRRTLQKRAHRLAREAYTGETTVTFTACVQRRGELFVDSEVVEAFKGALRRACDGYKCAVILYCFMPDHMHVSLRGKTPSSDTWKAMVLFKQLSGHWLARNRAGFLWQGDFYDHVVRKEEDLHSHLRYIIANPVRRGLVAKWDDYPFTGSDMLDLEDILAG